MKAKRRESSLGIHLSNENTVSNDLVYCAHKCAPPADRIEHESNVNSYKLFGAILIIIRWWQRHTQAIQWSGKCCI